jgi:hypothetical protein
LQHGFAEAAIKTAFGDAEVFRQHLHPHALDPGAGDLGCPNADGRMIASLSLILLCQLAGEVIVRGLGLPMPGPVVGLMR